MGLGPLPGPILSTSPPVTRGCGSRQLYTMPFPVLYGMWFVEELAESRAIFCRAEVRIQQTAFLCPGSVRSGGSRPDVCAFIPAIASTGLPAGKIQHLLCVGGLGRSEGLGLSFLPRRLNLAVPRSSHRSCGTPCPSRCPALTKHFVFQPLTDMGAKQSAPRAARCFARPPLFQPNLRLIKAPRVQ